MSDLVGNPEDWFSHNEAHLQTAISEFFKALCNLYGLAGLLVSYLVRNPEDCFSYDAYFSKCTPNKCI